MAFLNVPPMGSIDYWKAVLQNGLGCTLGSLLAILISYRIYLATTAQNRREREQLEASNNANSRNYFSLQIRNLVATADQQLANLQSFVDDIAANPTVYPMLPYTPMYEFKRVSESQDLDKVLLAYSSTIPGDHQLVNHFSNVIANIDYINAQMDILIKQLEKAQGFDHDRKKQLQVLYREMFGHVTDLLSMNSYSYSGDLRQALEGVMNNFMNKQGSPSDFVFLFDEFVIPLKTAMDGLYKAGDRSAEVYQLGSVSMDAIRIYEDMKKQIDAIATSVKETRTNVKEKGLDMLKENAASLGIVVPDQLVQ